MDTILGGISKDEQRLALTEAIMEALYPETLDIDQSRPSENPEPPRELKSTSCSDETKLSAIPSRRPGFRAQDIGYFDPDPDVQSIEAKETHRIYHNVFAFTDRLKICAITTDTKTTTTNLASCLINRAHRWYTEELSDMTREALQTTTIEVLRSALERRSWDSPDKALEALKKEIYPIHDVRRGRDPAAYIHSIVSLSRSIKTDGTEYPRVLKAWQQIDDQLLYDLQIPVERSLC